MSRRVIGVAVALWFIAVACGGTAPSGGATSAPVVAAGPGAIGDRIEANGAALTVIKAERKDALSDFQKAKAGNVFVVVEVLIENAGTAKAPYNPFYFTIKDGDGFESNAALGTDDQALKSGELGAGEKARGVVAFEVKRDAKGLVLQYKPLVFGAGDAIRVALP